MFGLVLFSLWRAWPAALANPFFTDLRTALRSSMNFSSFNLFLSLIAVFILAWRSFNNSDNETGSEFSLRLFLKVYPCVWREMLARLLVKNETLISLLFCRRTVDRARVDRGPATLDHLVVDIDYRTFDKLTWTVQKWEAFILRPMLTSSSIVRQTAWQKDKK